MKELLKQYKFVLIALVAAALGFCLSWLIQSKRIETLRSSESLLLNNCLAQTVYQGNLIDLDNTFLEGVAASKRNVLKKKIEDNTNVLDPILKRINDSAFWMP